MYFSDAAYFCGCSLDIALISTHSMWENNSNDNNKKNNFQDTHLHLTTIMSYSVLLKGCHGSDVFTRNLEKVPRNASLMLSMLDKNFISRQFEIIFLILPSK